jgi:hypothetical protein
MSSNPAGRLEDRFHIQPTTFSHFGQAKSSQNTLTGRSVSCLCICGAKPRGEQYAK